MTFDEILTQVLELLQREGRVSYRALKRRFDLDEDYLDDLKAEIIQAKQLAVDEDGAVLPVARQVTRLQAETLVERIAKQSNATGRPIKAVIRDPYFMAATVITLKRLAG